jgi:hypothetical protein
VSHRRDRAGRTAVGSLGSLLLALAAAACSDRDAPSAWSQRDSAGVLVVENARPRDTGWRLEEAPAALIRADGASDSTPADPVSVFGDGQGRIVVADRRTGALLFYDADGSFRSSVTTARAGPAASATASPPLLWWAARYRGDSLATFDQAARVIAVYGPDGTFARQLPIPAHRRDGAFGVPGFTAGASGPMQDGSFLTYPAGAPDRDAVEGPAWYRHDLLRLSPEGERWDTLGVFEIFQTYLGPTWPEPYPFGAVAFAVPHPDGFVFTTAESFELRVHDGTGALRRIVRRAHAPAVVNAADLEQYRSWYVARARGSGNLDDEAAARLEAQLDSAHHPERRPAISNVLVDDEGNVWAEEFRWVEAAEVAPDPRPSRWSVFGPEGRWLAQVEVPAGFLLSSVCCGHVYGVLVDAGDAKSVRTHRLIR